MPRVPTVTAVVVSPTVADAIVTATTARRLLDMERP